jgi:hypothetical protein
MEIRPSQLGDHSGKSSHSNEEQKSLDVVRQRTQRSPEASQRKVPSLLELSINNLQPEELRDPDVQLYFRTLLENPGLGRKEEQNRLQQRLYEHCIEFFDTREGSEWFKGRIEDLLCKIDSPLHNTGKDFFNTQAWKEFISAQSNTECIKGIIKKYFASGNGWLMKNYPMEVFQSNVGNESITSEEFNRWINTETGKRNFNEFIKSESSIDFFNKSLGLCLIKGIKCNKFIESSTFANLMYNHHKKFLNETEAGKELVKTEAICKWFDTNYGRDFLYSRRSEILNTEAGKELGKNETFCKMFCKWLDKSANEPYYKQISHFYPPIPKEKRFPYEDGLWIFETEAGKEMVKTKTFHKWLATSNGENYITSIFKTKARKELIKDNNFLKSEIGRKFIYLNFKYLYKNIREEFIESLKTTEEGKKIANARKIIFLPSKEDLRSGERNG